MPIIQRFDKWLGEEISWRRGLLVYASLGIYYGFLVAPIIWVAFSTFKEPHMIFNSELVPDIDSFTLDNWVTVLSRDEFQQYAINSTIIATGTTILTLCTGTWAAYSISRMEYPGRSKLIIGFLSTQMLPRVLILVPFFLIMYNLGLVDTHLGLILAHTVIALPLAIWLLKGFFDDIPSSLEDAAKMDGCSDLQALYYIILPLSIPGIAVTAFYSFIVSWNDYLFVSILATTDNTQTLPLALALFQSAQSFDWAAVITVATLTMLPVLILFTFVQSYLVEGLSNTGMKGG